jgi:prepilin-type N-terminal cleavage/methylation domain-containing protein
MKRFMSTSLQLTSRGMALPEMLIAAAVTSVIAAAMLTGIASLQQSFRASQHHAKSQIEQSRLLSYVCRDLRRAITVNVDAFEGGERLTLTIPDYYDRNNKPRDPRIKNDAVSYGDPAVATPDPITIRFYKSGSTVFRSVKSIRRDGGVAAETEVATALATNVQDFDPDFTDDGQQSIGVSISFIPKFQTNPTTVGALRAGTAVFATTLLRNKRS